MTSGPAPKRHRYGNRDDLVSVLLPFATNRSWIKYMDESDSVNSQLDINSFHSQRGTSQVVSHAGIFTENCLGFSKLSAVVALLCVICQIFVLKVLVLLFSLSHEAV